jgi:hypothetical protein
LLDVRERGCEKLQFIQQISGPLSRKRDAFEECVELVDSLKSLASEGSNAGKAGLHDP